MSISTWQECLVSQQADGAALTASTTATSLTHATGKLTLPAGYFYIGRRLRIRAAGRISTIVTTPGTLTLDVRFGAVIAANGGAQALNIVAKTNVPWFLDMELTCRAVGSGAAANMMFQGTLTSEAIIGAALPSAGGAGVAMLPNAAPTVGTGFDSTASQAIDFFGTWSLNNANSITVHQFFIDALN